MTRVAGADAPVARLAALLPLLVAACGPALRHRRAPAAADTPAAVLVSFRNEVGGYYQLKRVHVEAAGRTLMSCETGEGALDAGKPVGVADLRLAPGTHSLRVELSYRVAVDTPYGYISGYVFRLKKEHQLTLAPGETVTASLVACELWGPDGARLQVQRRRIPGAQAAPRPGGCPDTITSPVKLPALFCPGE